MADPAAITAIMQRMWTQFRPQMEERAAVLKSAAAAIAAGTVTEAERFAAEKTAHTLAGSLGTFGLLEGTTLAREAEALLVADVSDAPGAVRIAEIAEALEAMILAKP
jgi:HPt (histidine-containing phosphotransfer) domain-containing protein